MHDPRNKKRYGLEVTGDLNHFKIYLGTSCSKGSGPPLGLLTCLPFNAPYYTRNKIYIYSLGIRIPTVFELLGHFQFLIWGGMEVGDDPMGLILYTPYLAYASVYDSEDPILLPFTFFYL